MSTSGTHTTFNNCLNAGIYDGIFTYGMRSMGEALLNAKLYIKQVYGSNHDTQANYFAHWCNLMGDPTVCLLYTSDAADDLLCVDLGGRRIIQQKNNRSFKQDLKHPHSIP